jgi:hypothetical protein
MKQTTKDKYKEHTKLRYIERYHIALSNEDYDELCGICEKEEGIGVHNRLKQTKHNTRKIVMFKDKYILCVFDSKNKIVKTVLGLNKRFKKLIK